MHPSQVGIFRKTVTIIVLAAFTLGLMMFTVNANIRLLSDAYPDPQMVGFGILALEGGVVVWLALYFLFASGLHKGLCVIAMGVDILISGAGFYIEISKVSHVQTALGTPTITDVVAFAVLFNVAWGMMAKLIPAYTPRQAPAPRQDNYGYEGYQEQTLAKTDSVGAIGEKVKDVAANLLATGQEIQERAAEKRGRGRPSNAEKAAIEAPK